MMSDSSDQNDSPIVIDLGSSMCQAGFAGDDSPNAIFSTIVGRFKCNTSLSRFGKDDYYYIGDKAQAYRDKLSLRYPIERGIITNWEDMEKIWQHTFNELRITPEDCNVLLTEPALNPKANRERMAQVMFETFNVHGFYVAIQALLSLYSSARVTGVSMDCGDGVTHVVPAYEGIQIPAGIQRVDLAGKDVTQYLQRLLNARGESFVTTSDFETIKALKEKLSYAALESDSENAAGTRSSAIQKSYKLPDGQVITFGSERFQCAEILFHPSLCGYKLPGIHEVFYNSIMNCDINVRSDLFRNAILSGGTTMTPGLSERIEKELSALVPSSQTAKVIAAPERNKLVWLGGSIIASLSSFDRVVISKQEYEDVGPYIVHRKCY